MASNQITWPDADLAIEELSDGLLVTQRGIRYKARNFALASEILDILGYCIPRGVDCLVRTSGGGHPRRDKWEGGKNFELGSHSIPFYRSFEKNWIFALDQALLRSREVVFQKHWQHEIDNSGVPWRWERGGGQNIFVPYDYFFQAVDAIIGETANLAVESYGPQGSPLEPVGRSAKFTQKFEVGRVYNRRHGIHAVYGGQSQGGIWTPQGRPEIFLFTGREGTAYGYEDGFDEHGVFLYTGEGQLNDMEFVRGNLAIRDHTVNGKELHMFESLGKGKGVRYKGRFTCVTWEYRPGPDKSGKLRRTIVFHLIPESSEQDLSERIDQPVLKTLDELRRKAYAAAAPAAEAHEGDAKTRYYERSADVRRYVLARAEGRCESCREPAPFDRKDGTPYLEPHHTRRVSDGGPDHPRWVGAICPNCHRHIHHGSDGVAKNKQLEDYLQGVEGSG